MIFTFRSFSKCYSFWFYLGLLFLLCCRPTVYAAENVAKSKSTAGVGIEKAALPVASEDQNQSEPTERTASNPKQTSSLAELEQKQKFIYLELNKKIDINTKDIESQKVLIENYAAGSFETLLKMADLTEKVDKLALGDTRATGQQPDERQGTGKSLEHLWMLVVIFLVSLAPFAFTAPQGQQSVEKPSATTHGAACLSECFHGVFPYWLWFDVWRFGSRLDRLVQPGICPTACWDCDFRCFGIYALSTKLSHPCRLNYQ